MRISNAVGYTLTAAIVLTMLAERSGGASPVLPRSLAQTRAGSPSGQPQAFQTGRLKGFLGMREDTVFKRGLTGPSFMDSRALGKPLVFVSYGVGIDIYLQGGKNKMVGQITGPSGFDLATDTAGDLYSANAYLSSGANVTIYAPPYTHGPKLTLTGRTSLVIAVSRQGTVAVLGCTNPSGSCTAGFLFYAAGSSAPCAGIPYDASAFPNGVFGAAFDRKGNLYFANSGSGTEAPLAVGKIDGGCNAKQAKTLTTTNSIPYAATIRVDKAGRIAILTASSDLNTVAIDSYNPPKGSSLGSPISTTPLPGTASSYSGTFAFVASGLGLWAGNEGLGSSYAGGASKYAYPAGGAPQRTILGAPESAAYGVAVSPALVP